MAIEPDELHSTLHTLKTFGMEQNEAHVCVFAFCMHVVFYLAVLLNFIFANVLPVFCFLFAELVSSLQITMITLMNA